MLNNVQHKHRFILDVTDDIVGHLHTDRLGPDDVDVVHVLPRQLREGAKFLEEFGRAVCR